MQQINHTHVHFLQKRQKDHFGRVFSWRNRIYRAIFPHNVKYAKTLFSSGFLDDIIARGYFPPTWITDYEMEEYPLILEHERTWPVVYPQEWTYSMLRDAALMVYDLHLIAKKYKFNMKDCHGLNVLFDVTPKYIDLGSFIPDNYVGWYPYGEFLRFYYYPLKIWQQNSFLGKLSIFSGNLIQHEAYFRYKYPILRHVNANFLNTFLSYFFLYDVWCNQEVALNTISDDHSDNLYTKTNLRTWIRKIIPIRPLKPKKIVKEIGQLHPNVIKSSWGTYHEEVKDKANRFERIIDILITLENNIETAADLGGNQGRFSSLVAERTNVGRIVCVDIDEEAIDKGYNREKTNSTNKLTFANYDFMGGITKISFSLPNKRFRSDVVFALALTHHLILAQGYDLGEILKNISSYSQKYVFIEFMPLGLWITGQEPSVPTWYTLEWFRDSFCKFFELLYEEKLRINNILFVGKVRSGL